MTCDDQNLALNALIDGELPAANQAPLLDHLATCPACATTLAGLLLLRGQLAQLAPREAPSLALTQRLDAALTAPKPALQFPPKRPTALLTVTAGFALAASLLLALLLRPAQNPALRAPPLRAIADAGLRQSIPARAIVLADNRLGGADAWFAAHHLAQPPAPDLRQAGFQFVGCRTDIIAGHHAAILVYRHGAQKITLTAWPAPDQPRQSPRSAHQSGQSIRYWRNGKLAFWISGTKRHTVRRFTTAYRTSS